MSENNFIWDIVEQDLKNEKYSRTIQTRFPPEPNGYLHIGHAKAIWMDFTTAKKFGGICNLRFDDTNPQKEEQEYADAIKRDLNWLGYQWNQIYHASDYFGELYNYAIELIKKGLAYVDDQSADEIRENRGTLTEPGKNSPYRNRTEKENLVFFEGMKNGEYEEGEKVLRAKIDMSSPNINMRDPVMYRILKKAHDRTGDTWNIYPMYDYAHPMSDAIEQVTHSLCTLEFEDHRPVYEWFLEHTNFNEPPQQIEFARLNLTGTIMSKRYLKQLVDEGLVESWDDPRMPTISGFRRRGYTPASIRRFCEEIGVSKANSVVDMGMLEAFIRDDLNQNAPRAMAVMDPLKLTITNIAEGETIDIEIENNPNDESAGSRIVPLTRDVFIEKGDFMVQPPNKKYHRLKPEGEVRLKGAYIIKCEDYKTDENGEVIEVLCTYDPQTKSGECDRKVKGTIHWVSEQGSTTGIVREYEPMLLDGEGDFMQRFNKDSVIIHENVKLEKMLSESKPEQQFQFMRTGYFVRDNKEDGLVFNKIVGLKDTWAKINK